MIRKFYAYADSTGVVHETREAACKAEFRRALEARFQASLRFLDDETDEGEAVIPLAALVDALFDLDKLVGDAMKEDTAVQRAEGGNGL